MIWIVTSMKWIMLVSGLLTCTMLYATVAPQAPPRPHRGRAEQSDVHRAHTGSWSAIPQPPGRRRSRE
jgi:hypothetical protein